MRSSVLGQKRPTTRPPVRIRTHKDGSIDRLLATSTGTTRRAFPNPSTGPLSDTPPPASPVDQNKLGRVHSVSSSEALPGKAVVSHQGPSLPEFRVVLPDKCHPYPRHHSQHPDPHREEQCKEEEPIKTEAGRVATMVNSDSEPDDDSDAELAEFLRWQKKLRQRRSNNTARGPSPDRETKSPRKKRQISNKNKAGTKLEKVSNKHHQERMRRVAGEEEKTDRLLQFKDVSGQEFTFPFQYCCTWAVRTFTIALSIV